MVKDVTPTEMPETEGPATFTVTVSNPGPDPLLLDVTLVDDVFGDLNGRGTCVLPVSLALGASFSCTFDAVVHGTRDSAWASFQKSLRLV